MSSDIKTFWYPTFCITSRFLQFCFSCWNVSTNGKLQNNHIHFFVGLIYKEITLLLFLFLAVIYRTLLMQLALRQQVYMLMPNKKYTSEKELLS